MSAEIEILKSKFADLIGWERRKRNEQIFALIFCISWALAILHVRSRHWLGSPLQLAPWQLLAAVPPLLAGALLLEGDWRPQPSWELGLILLHNGLLATGFCYWGAFTVTRALPAISTSLGFLGVPVAGVASSALVVGEPLTAGLAVGASMQDPARAAMRSELRAEA